VIEIVNNMSDDKRNVNRHVERQTQSISIHWLFFADETRPVVTGVLLLSRGRLWERVGRVRTTGHVVAAGDRLRAATRPVAVRRRTVRGRAEGGERDRRSRGRRKQW